MRYVAHDRMNLRPFVRSSDRKVESHGVEAALQMLHKATEDISVLAADVDAFADWWVMAETMLSAVQSHVEQLNAEKISAIRVRGVKREWTAIKGEYLNYKIHVSAPICCIIS